MSFSSSYLLLFSLLVAFFSIRLDATEPPQAGLDKLVRPFFAEHCNACHDAKKQKGDLRVDSMAINFQSPKTMMLWEEIMNRINSGDMPPVDEKRPKPEDIAKVSEWIAEQLHEGEALRQSGGGEKVTFHKLTREEYANAVRDLLGVNFDVKGPWGLPEDPDWHGFERIGSVLTLSPAHVEKYLTAAEAVLDEALSIRPQPKRETITWTPWDMRWKNFKEEYEARGIADQVRIEIVPNNYTTDSWNLEVKTTGEYVLRLKVSGLRPEGGRAPRLKVYMSSIDKTLIEQDIVTAEDKPVTVEARVHLIAGNYPIRLINSVPGPNPEGRRSRHSGTPNAFTNVRSRVPWQLKLTDDDFKAIQPTLILDRVEWDGPIVESWPTPAHQRIFASKDAREIVTNFASRAWRRPAIAAEVTPLLRPFEQSQKLGDSFELSVKNSLVAVLCSKSFLYLVEGDSKQSRPQLTDLELASRLAFFLWSGPPDAKLLQLAQKGTLHAPATLRAEVQRMLADARSTAFATSFPRQWLQLREVGMFPPDKELYPDYDENLEKSMVAETVAFFGEMLRRNGRLRDFLDSDWTLINERLAMHYGLMESYLRARQDKETLPISLSHGLPVSPSDAFIRLPLTLEDHRGGLLTHASVLSLTSDGTRHRPVHRGVWMLECIIGKPAPPPPANVPALTTPDPKVKKTTVREKLELHRSDPNCTACHNKIDPLGIAFDNYDAIGRWRIVETIKDGTGANPALDPSGQLPDGRAFKDSLELRQLLVTDLDKFATALTEKLATYALRRAMTFGDREALKQIAEEVKKGDYQLMKLIENLIASPLFLKR